MKILACQLMESPPIPRPETKVTHIEGKTMNDVHFFIAGMAEAFHCSPSTHNVANSQKDHDSRTMTPISAGPILLAAILCLHCLLQFSENLIVSLRYQGTGRGIAVQTHGDNFETTAPKEMCSAPCIERSHPAIV